MTCPKCGLLGVVTSCAVCKWTPPPSMDHPDGTTHPTKLCDCLECRLRAKITDLRKQNDDIVRQWNADLRAARDRWEQVNARANECCRERDELRAENEILHEKITRDSREAFRVMAQLNAENTELRARIERIQNTDQTEVIGTLLADKTNLKYALTSIGKILKVAEQL